MNKTNKQEKNCKYLISTDKHGYTTLNAHEFVKDLAPLLAGVAEGDECDIHHGLIKFPNGFYISLRPKWNSTVHWNFHCGFKTGNMYRCDDEWPECNVSIYKDLEQIAKEIKKKLIDASQDLIAKCHEEILKTQQDQNEMQAAVDNFKKAFPNARVDFKEGDIRADYYLKDGNGNYLHIDGYFYKDGEISIKNMPYASLSQLQLILNVFACKDWKLN